MSDEAAAAEPPAETTTGIDISGPPQEMYKFLRDHMPVMTVDHELMQGTSVALHDDVMTVLQNPQIFSSDGAAEIGQIRPLIPLEIDPPEHAKYRKLLDPLFAPRRVALLEPSTRALATSLIEAVVDDGHCNFHKAIAEPLPSQVFLTMFGLPVERTPEFIELKDGIIRPPVKSATEARGVPSSYRQANICGIAGGGRPAPRNPTRRFPVAVSGRAGGRNSAHRR